MKWFANVRTVEELRKQYRQLMKKHHPDVGGNTEDAKEINSEYERLFAVLSRQEPQERPQGEQESIKILPRTKPPRIEPYAPFWTLWLALTQMWKSSAHGCGLLAIVTHIRSC